MSCRTDGDASATIQYDDSLCTLLLIKARGIAEVIYQSQSRDIRMLLAGEVMPSRRLTPFIEPDYLAAIELIRSADVGFTNLETVVRTHSEGTPAFTRGTPMTTAPILLEDLKWMGFNLLSTANNHMGDFGPDGAIATVEHLRRADLAFAGSGRNLGEALMPGYLDTKAGRVGLVAATTIFKQGEQAAAQRPDTIGRAGVNPVRFTTTYSVDDATMAALDRIGLSLGLAQDNARARQSFFSATEFPEDTATTLNFLGADFRRDDKFGRATTVNAQDAEANLRAIREARRQADWVLFSLHNHEYGGAGRTTAKTRMELEIPADFVIELSRAAIDAGADAVVGHGMHVTLGIEIYRGKPIFYSLGNHILQNDTIEIVPAEAYGRFGLGMDATPADFLDARNGNGTRSFAAYAEYWETVAASCVFTNGALTELRLHPIDLGFGLSRPQQGRPVLAHGETARRILDRVVKLSRNHGTRIEMDGETAVVRL
jgi:poly-gamma-glutamate synthesis protein (capsule biosynthesis protein)